MNAPIANVDVVTLGSMVAALGDRYAPATGALSSPCTTDPTPDLALLDVSQGGTPGDDPTAVDLERWLGPGSSQGYAGIDHRPEVIAFLARAGATRSTHSHYAVYFQAGVLTLSRAASPAPDAQTCGPAYVHGLEIEASLVWGIDVVFDHQADAEAAAASYGPKLATWFTRADAAWVGAALAGKATMTVRAVQIGGDGSQLATIANATRCSFAAVSECAATMTHLRARAPGPPHGPSARPLSGQRVLLRDAPVELTDKRATHPFATRISTARACASRPSSRANAVIAPAWRASASGE